MARLLVALAAAADRRAEELGTQLADDPPVWLESALGAAPAEGDDRARWVREAGTVAAYRERRGHDDPSEALGPAQKPGQVEQYATYRAAWRMLRPPGDRARSAGAVDGQLHMRVRAYEREEAWGPRYVGNELAGTRQAAATARQ